MSRARCVAVHSTSESWGVPFNSQCPAAAAPRAAAAGGAAGAARLSEIVVRQGSQLVDLNYARSSAAALAPLGRVVIMVPGLKHQEQLELAPPPSASSRRLALRKIESRNVLAVESLKCHAATILESRRERKSTT